MAVLSKIRQRSVFLIIIIALALFSFVLSGIFDSNSPLFNKNVSEIGEVNDEPIGREEFAQQVEYFRNIGGNKMSSMQQVNNAWNNLVREKIYKTQLEKSGIVVGEQDVWNAIVNQIKAQRNPMFMNEAGMFDEDRLKEYVAGLKENATVDEQSKAAWLNWVNYEKSIKNSIQQNTYNTLVTAGLNATLKDGERSYFYNNDNVNIKYVYVPYSSIPDSLVKVSKDEIKKYIKDHPNLFKVEAANDLEFVKFDIKPTKEDEEAVRKEVASLMDDKEEYSSAAKTTVKVTGFANATDMRDFFATFGSDIPLDENFYTKKDLPKILADSLFDKEIGAVYGPYKDKDFYKISKLTAVKQMPDSVKASHILISYAGSAVRDPSIKMTQEEAQKIADSILQVVKANPSKFAEIAKEMSVDRSNADKGGDLGWFVYKTMVPEFRDYVFNNKTGDIGIVKTRFGYHIIRIDGQKNKQKHVQIATFGRKIEPSEKTENEIFQKAESFASEASSGKDFKQYAKELGYTVVPAVNLKELDETVYSLGSQRQIVRWSFNKDTKEGDIKRFDTDNGYAVVRLVKKHKKGLADRFGIARSELIKEKKAKLIADRSKGDTLEDIAKANNTRVKTALAVSNASPVLPGDGRLPVIVGVVTGLEENKLTKNIKGQQGVAFAVVTKRNKAVARENYLADKSQIQQQLQSRGRQVYEAIKKKADITDNRAVFY